MFNKLNVPILLTLTWISILVTFTTIALIYIDPDYGLHQRLGEYAITNGLPKTDPFSYTMPSYHLIDHEWLTNILMYRLNQTVGWPILALIYSSLATLALYILTIGSDKRWQLVSILLSAPILANIVGVRPQIATWIGFSTLVFIQSQPERWKRWKFYLPILFLIWANLHGGFAMGLVALTIYIAAQSYLSHKLNPTDLIILGFSILATLLNPYGTGVWYEVWNTVSDSDLRWRIQEWSPIILTFNLPFIIFIGFSLPFICKFWRQLPLHQLIISNLLLLGTLASQRHVTLYVLATIPLLINSMTLFYEQARKHRYSLLRFQTSYKIILIIALIGWIASMLLDIQSSQSRTEKSFYPKQAIEYLRDNPTEGNLFAPYYWGSYLIWKYPEEKVFIYGSMPSWKLAEAPEGELKYAFEEYLKIESNEGYFEPVFDQYKITRVIWRAKVESQSPIYDLVTKINNFVNSLSGSDYSTKELPEQLAERGWYIVYQDKIAVVYQRPQQ